MQIKQWRKNNGLTQRNLADASKLDVRWIQKLEAGEISIENVTVKKFSMLVKGICDLSNQQPPDTETKQIREISQWLEDLLQNESR